MFKKSSLTRVFRSFLWLLVFSGTTCLFAQRKDASTLNAIKGKTYIGWSMGAFDDNPNANSASRFVFDASGNAQIHSFLAYRPTDASATNQQIAATYITLNGRPALKFTVNGGVDAGSAYITSYDGGTKVWAESTYSNRPMKGWMLLVPSNPQ